MNISGHVSINLYLQKQVVIFVNKVCSSSIAYQLKNEKWDQILSKVLFNVLLVKVKGCLSLIVPDEKSS